MLRQIRTAVLVDKIERMAEIAGIHALPRAFGGAERQWYRGLAYLEDQVIPVINPTGFLTAGEFERLDGAMAAPHAMIWRHKYEHGHISDTKSYVLLQIGRPAFCDACF